jgi:protein-tyrosine phosphatase
MRPRWLPLTGASNARDLGGLPLKSGGVTRHGVLLRSDTLQELTDADVAWLQAAGLHTVIDLRAPAEAAREGRGPLADTEVAYASLPFIPDEAIIPDDPRHEVIVADRRERDRVEHYLDYLRLAAPRVVAALDLLASPGAAPALFHCAAGKDRTGVLAAIVLEMNGVERDAIIADFALTNERLHAVAQRLLRLPTYERGMRRISWQALQADPQTMRDFLLRIDDDLGGPSAWAVAHGLDAGAANRLCRLLH